MSFVLSLFLSVFALSAQQPEKMNVVCITEIPTTSFIGETEKGKIKFRLVNSFGVKYMPISTSLITFNDLNTIQQRGQALQVLGKESEFEFDLKRCQSFNDGNFSCLGNDKFKTESGEEVEAIQISSSRHSVKFYDMKFEQFQISASFKIRGESQDMMMRYGPGECAITF
jgi:hypothetical protein